MADIAFVAGATGLTGRSVVAELCAKGARTHAHVRPDSGSLGTWRERFEGLGAEVDSTPWDEAAMRARLEALAPTVVFALLGTTKKRARRAAKEGRDPEAEGYEAVDYGLSALLRRAAEGSGCSPRFVYLSSMGVTDTTKNPYLEVRARMERELRDGALPYVAARPSFILGDRDEARLGEAVGGAFADGALSVLGALGGKKLRDKYSSMSGEQLGRALVAAGLDPTIRGVVEADALRELASL